MTDARGDFPDPAMLALFRQETEKHCAFLCAQVPALEQTPGNPELLTSFLQALKSVSGTARIVNVESAIAISQAATSYLSAALTGAAPLDNAALASLRKGITLLTELSVLPEEKWAEWHAAHGQDLDGLAAGTPGLPQHDGQSPEAAGSLPDEKREAGKYAREEDDFARGDLADLSMLELFRLETENHCATLSDSLLALEKNPADAGLLESLMRAAHSVKGAARIVNIEAGVKVAHSMEDIFVAAQKGRIVLGKTATDALLAGVDFLADLTKLREETWAEQMAACAARLPHLLGALEQLQQEEKTAASPAPEKNMPKPAPEKQPARTAGEGKAEERAIRVSSENMNRLMGLAGEVLIESRWLPTFSRQLLRIKQGQDRLLSLVNKIEEETALNPDQGITKGRLRELRGKLDFCRNLTLNNLAVLEGHARHATTISHRLYREVIASRMRPFSEGVRAFPRLVRDVSQELGKQIKLEIVGADTPVDRDILEKMEAPLNHLVRNAIDHGLESPEERRQSNKPEQATIWLEAHHRAGMLNIIVRDDGRGIDIEELRRVVVEKKLVSAEMAADLRDSELIEFLFLPNFSTRKTVSSISGRGVGLDVVHSVIHEVRGMVRASTKKGDGTSFEMQLPLTLSVLRALLTEINGEPYAFPLVGIDHLLSILPGQMKTVEGRQYLVFNERRVGLVSAQQVFKKPLPPPPKEGEEIKVIIFSDRFNHYGVTVDRYLDVRDLVVQPLDPRLGKVKDIGSAAILEDGTPVLVVDLEDMARSMDLLISGNRLQRIGDISAAEEPPARKRILVVDDSITVREMERKMLGARNYEVDVAVDGMDALNSIRNNVYHLVITDIDMPRLNGIELVEAIRSDSRYSRLPVIIISYKDRKEDRERGVRAGADHYLTKGSFHDETFIKAVRDLIGGPEIQAPESQE